MKSTSQLKTVIAAALLFSLCGCASIVSHSTWPVTLNSNPTGAEVTITDPTGYQQKGTTPFTLKLKSGRGFFTAAYYIIEVKLDGYSTAKARLDANINGWYFGNIVIGGLIGMIAVDPVTGAMWRLPKQYSVNLPKTTADSSEHTLQIVSIDTIPKELRSQLIAIR